MSRRAALPGAAELFRTTSSSLDEARPEDAAPEGEGRVHAVAEPAAGQGPGGTAAHPSPAPAGRAAAGHTGRPTRLRRVRGGATPPSGRERHEEKITVYLSAEELMALEDARVTLYREHALKVDRGRIVREAIALVVADLEAKGTNAVLVRQLNETA